MKRVVIQLGAAPRLRTPSPTSPSPSRSCRRSTRSWRTSLAHHPAFRRFPGRRQPGPRPRRALAVTSLKRSTFAPDIPAVAETIPGFEAVSWWGLLVPRGTPQAAITALNAAANKALASPAFIERLAGLGAEAQGGTPARFRSVIADELAKWPPVVRATGAKLS